MLAVIWRKSVMCLQSFRRSFINGNTCLECISLIPIDPNPAISARALFPQSGHIRPEKRPFFQKFPHYSRIEPYKKYEPLIGVKYIKLKPIRSSIKC